jgi:hypothetical protein
VGYLGYRSSFSAIQEAGETHLLLTTQLPSRL